MDRKQHQKIRNKAGKQNSYSVSERRIDPLELANIERSGVVINENCKKIQRACLDQDCPIVIGQRGACYKIMDKIDKGSYGVIYHSR